MNCEMFPIAARSRGRAPKVTRESACSTISAGVSCGGSARPASRAAASGACGASGGVTSLRTPLEQAAARTIAAMPARVMLFVDTTAGV
jgi:hypothetical protein